MTIERGDWMQTSKYTEKELRIIRQSIGRTVDPKTKKSYFDVLSLLNVPLVNFLAHDALQGLFEPDTYDAIIAPESRGWLYAQPIALDLKKGFVPVCRWSDPAARPGRYNCHTLSLDYQTESGWSTLAIRADLLQKGSRVLIIDDVLATRNTARALVRLAEMARVEVVGIATLINIGGTDDELISDRYPVRSVLNYKA